MPENFMVTEIMFFCATGQYEFYFKYKRVQFRTTT